jgi:signal transduction histidine kinase
VLVRLAGENSCNLYRLSAPILHPVASLAASAGERRLTARSALRRYAVPLVGMPAAAAIGIGLRYIHAGHSAVTIAFLLVSLASAWWGGYGPGILACLFGLFVAPYIFTQGFNVWQADLGRAVLVLLVSVLISRVADNRRRIEEALREANERLDARVRERTDELQKSNTELTRVNEALNEFSYSVSHDLQQPLRMITLYAQLLDRNCRGEFTAEANEYVGAILSGASQMKLLLEDLLTYSRTAHTPSESVGVVDVNSVVSKVLSNLKEALEESQAVVEIPKLPALRVHEFHLTELFQNLISNALKYRSDGRPFITIGAEQNDDFWTFSVADNGIGIAPEHATQIFGLFKRLHSSDSYEGTGVGLAICERIVERYEGQIWVEPRSPRGSTFFFKLRPKAASPVAEDLQPLAQSASERGTG